MLKILQSFDSSSGAIEGIEHVLKIAQENGLRRILAVYPSYQSGKSAIRRYLEESLKNENASAILSGVEIHTFQTLARAIIKGDKSIPESPIWLSKLFMQRASEDLAAEKKHILTPAFLVELYSQFERMGLTSEIISQMVETRKTDQKNEFAVRRFALLKEIFAKYEKELSEHGLVTQYSLLSLAAYELQEAPEKLGGAVVLISDFVDFSFREWEFISTIIASGAEVIVTLMHNHEFSGSFFEISKKTLSIFENRFKCQKELIRANQRNATFNLENLYLHDKGDAGFISIMCAFTKFEEVSAIAHEIKKLVLKHKVSPDEIVVFFKNGDYEPLLLDTFKEYGIPINYSAKRKLSESIGGKFILALKSAVLRSQKFEACSNFILHPWVLGEAGRELTLKAIADKADSIKSWKKLLEGQEEKSNAVNLLISLWETSGLEKLDDTEQELKNARSQLSEIVADNFILDLIKIFKEQAKAIDKDRSSDADTLDESRYLSKLIEKLEKLKISVSRFADEIGKGDVIFWFSVLDDLLEEKIGNSRQGGVTVADISQSRLGDYDYVFLCGLNQGEFPLVETYSPFLNDEDKDLFDKKELRFQSADYSVMRDRYLFYVAGSKAKQKLFLTFTGDAADLGSNKMPAFKGASTLVLDVADKFSHDQLAEMVSTFSLTAMNQMSATEEIASRQGFIQCAGHTLAPYAELDVADGRQDENGFQENDRLRLFAEQGDFEGKIADAIYKGRLVLSEKRSGGARFWFGEYKWGAYTPNIAFFENYIQCPFKALVESVGRISEQRFLREVDPREQGSLEHNILKKVYERENHELPSGKYLNDLLDAVILAEDQKGTGETIQLKGTIAEIKAFVEKIFKEEIREKEAPSLESVISIEVDKLYKFIKNQRRFIKNNSICKHEVEQTFGKPGSKLEKPLIIPFSSKESEIEKPIKVELGGRIDRIDILSDDKINVVVDYKSKVEKVEKENYILDFQLPLYVEALRANKREVAGYVYCGIKNAEDKNSISGLTFEDCYIVQPAREKRPDKKSKPAIQQLSSDNFNRWLYSRLYACLEDFYDGDFSLVTSEERVKRVKQIYEQSVIEVFDVGQDIEKSFLQIMEQIDKKCKYCDSKFICLLPANEKEDE